MSDGEISERLQRIKDYLRSSNLRKEESLVTPPPSASHHTYSLPPEFHLARHVDLPSNSSSVSAEEEREMAQNNQMNRTLKELAMPDLDYQPLCIEYPNLEVAFELKPGLIHLLPIFHGLAGEDPNKHLKEFHVVCSSMKPTGISEEQIKLRAFPFSLADSAKEWLYYLPSGSITTWNEMKRLFLEKYFPASKAANIRKEICGIRQYNGESLYEYWERFKKLCASCPHHQISEQLLIQYFYEGLMPMERSMIDAASGGALVDKTPEAARSLIANMAANSQQFNTRNEPTRQPQKVNEVHSSSIEQQLAHLTSLVQQMAVKNVQQAKACGICHNMEHPTDQCPSLQEGISEQANAIGGFPGQPRRYDPFSNHYNEGWKDHPNLRYGNPQQGISNVAPNRPPGIPQPRALQYHPRAQQVPSNTETPLEDLVRALATSSLQFQQDIKTRMQNVETQIGQLATTVGRLEVQNSGKLPSQTIINPIEECKAINLRSGKELKDTMPKKDETEDEEKVRGSRKEASSENMKEKQKLAQKVIPGSITFPDNPPEITTPIPFPQRLQKKNLDVQFSKFLDVFKKLHINIPFIEALEQMPSYMKFMKDILKKKRRLKDYETVALTEECSSILQKKLPPKLKDPGSFSIPCSIGNSVFEKALCDLGASINLMPLSVFRKLGLGEVRPTTVSLQMADRSIKHPRGIIENVLVKVDKFIFPADFIVLDIEEDEKIPIILGRPFLATGRALIDVQKGELRLRVQEEEVTFNVFNTIKYPEESDSCFYIDTLDAFEYAKISKRRSKTWHEKHISRKKFAHGQKNRTLKVNKQYPKPYIDGRIDNKKTNMFLKPP